jgi:alpha-galactosidase
LLQKIDSVDIWVKPLQNGKWAYCFFNRSLKPFTLTQDWKNCTDTLTQKTIDFSTQVYAWQDAWLPKQKGDTRKPIKAVIGAHDVLLLELSPLSLLKKSK